MKLDHLEDLVKARKAKGLENWKKLEHVKDKLQGKQAAHITFTTSYPGQEGSKKHLGSATGNLYFLLGYVNPGFHVAPYHWQLVDPNLSDEEAAKKAHPANATYWRESDLDVVDEGDFDEGNPHPSAASDKRSKARTSERKTGAMRIQSGYGSYVAVPSEGHIYSLTNGHVYKWGIVRESFMSSTNPKMREAMDAVYEEGLGEAEYKKSLSNRTKFTEDVYPLVSRVFPKPGSTFAVEDFRAVVKSDRLEFFDQNRRPVHIQVFDRQYRYFDLKKSGDINPSFLLQFAIRYLGVDRDELALFAHTEEA